jgi:hypothetical protein
MPASIYLLLLSICSVVMSLFGFFVGRCGRKLPIIDNHLPWTMHRSQMPSSLEDGKCPRIPANYHRASNPELDHAPIRLITDSPHTDQSLCVKRGNSSATASRVHIGGYVRASTRDRCHTK